MLMVYRIPILWTPPCTSLSPLSGYDIFFQLREDMRCCCLIENSYVCHVVQVYDLLKNDEINK